MKKWIKCEKCGAKLAYMRNRWVEVEGRTNFMSDGTKFVFTCRDKRCASKYTYNIGQDIL